MPFKLEELQKAHEAYRQFIEKSPPKHHARYIFPFFTGSYFSYRKVDVLRIVAIVKALNNNDPSYLDIGCGYGDFLKRVKEYLPSASGVEKEGGIFHALGLEKPDYINIIPVESLSSPVDAAFVGWMEPSVDFRRNVTKIAKCVITTFDAGGQCGINGGCEYDEFGLQQIAWWRTPSWIDVNAEIMNRYYTKMSEEKRRQLAALRSAHNLWYVYAKPNMATKVKHALQAQVAAEPYVREEYDFESVLDECGFGYKEELSTVRSAKRLWEVILN